LEKSLIQSLADVKEIKIKPERKLFSATPEEILRGETSDIYFIRTHKSAFNPPSFHPYSNTRSLQCKAQSLSNSKQNPAG
jgi:hypothetical protein